MFGERMVIAAATGCNTIWGGSYPYVPYTSSKDNEGPAWANSLFENGAEFGYGITTGYRQRRENFADIVRTVVADAATLKGMTEELRYLMEEWLQCFMDFEKSRNVRDKLRPLLLSLPQDADERLKQLSVPSNMKLWARTSFWVFGGDGFAYDIGFGGLDHVISTSTKCSALLDLIFVR